jgi:copper chaperone NosL
MKVIRLFRALSFVIVHLSLVILLVACSSGSGEPQPPEIQYGEDVCDACGMLISDAKFAAASVDQDGTAHKFDDIGDLVTYYMQHDQATVKVYFVHDYPSEKWLRAEQAFFVVSPRIQTPMAHGIAAYADRVAAEAAAQKYRVKVMQFDEVRQQPMSGMSHMP